MDRFDGTAARQLLLVDDGEAPVVWRQAPPRPRPDLRLLRKDVYEELTRRRRRAQIAARHLIERNAS
jgi:hypothetical protein